MEPLISQKQPSHRLPYSTLLKGPECGKEFYGKSNRIYCSKECKKEFNNSKQAEMNFRVKDQVKMLKRNACILAEFYSVQSNPLMVVKEDLIRKGFIMDSPTIRLKAENGIEWHLIGCYVFRPENDGQEIVIMTKNDLENI